MSFQSYLDNIRAKTGKTPADFAELAAKKSLTKHGEIVAWLKKDFDLGHGHASAIAAVLLKSESRGATDEERRAKLFSGAKSVWKPSCDRLVAQVKAFGSDVVVATNESYVNLLRGKKKFGIVKPASADRMDVGIKCKAKKAQGRLEAAGAWDSMVSHRVRIEAPGDVDAELVAWLEEAYEATK